MFAVRPGHGLAQAIDAALVVVGDKGHGRARPREQRFGQLRFFGGNRACSHEDSERGGIIDASGPKREVVTVAIPYLASEGHRASSPVNYVLRCPTRPT